MASHHGRTLLAVILLLPACADSPTAPHTAPQLTHLGPTGSFHLEVSAVGKWPDAFDFEAPGYAAYDGPAADVRLGGPAVFEWPASIIGYRELLGLNGGGVANLGLADYSLVDCTTASATTFTASVPTPLGTDAVPTLGTVYLVKTAAGLVSKLELTGIDFTAPNGLSFAYEVLGCASSLPEIHLEVSDIGKWPDAFDFDGVVFAPYDGADADIRLGGPAVFESPASMIGYRELLALNGAGVANLGLVDFGLADCNTAAATTFTASVPTPLGTNLVPTLQTVFLARTAVGVVAKLILLDIDFTRPNGLVFGYELLGCAVSPQALVEGGIDRIEAYVAEGEIAAVDAEPLIAKLDGVHAKLERGHTQSAANQLGAFINQTEGLVRARRISAEAGSDLAAFARGVIATLGA